MNNLWTFPKWVALWLFWGAQESLPRGNCDAALWGQQLAAEKGTYRSSSSAVKWLWKDADWQDEMTANLCSLANYSWRETAGGKIGLTDHLYLTTSLNPDQSFGSYTAKLGANLNKVQASLLAPISVMNRASICDTTVPVCEEGFNPGPEGFSYPSEQCLLAKCLDQGRYMYSLVHRQYKAAPLLWNRREEPQPSKWRNTFMSLVDLACPWQSPPAVKYKLKCHGRSGWAGWVFPIGATEQGFGIERGWSPPPPA